MKLIKKKAVESDSVFDFELFMKKAMKYNNLDKKRASKRRQRKYLIHVARLSSNNFIEFGKNYIRAYLINNNPKVIQFVEYYVSLWNKLVLRIKRHLYLWRRC